MFCFLKKKAKHSETKTTQKESTVRASLIGSVASLLICALLFVGTTFAWYTSTVEAPTQEITLGNMTLQIGNYTGHDSITGTDDAWENYATASGVPLAWTLKKTSSTSQQDLWDPSDSGILKSFRVMNTGTIGVKYKVCIADLDGTSTDTAVLDSLQFYLKDSVGNLTPIDIYTLSETSSGLAYAANVTELSQSNALTAKAVSDEYTIVCTVNKYSTAGGGKTVGNLSVTAYATQDINSTDVNFGDTILVNDYAALVAAVNTAATAKIPMTIKLGQEITVPNGEHLTVSKNSVKPSNWVILDLNNHTLTGSANGILRVEAGATLAITDNSTDKGGGIILDEGGSESTLAIVSTEANSRLIVTGGTYTNEVNAPEITTYFNSSDYAKGKTLISKATFKGFSNCYDIATKYMKFSGIATFTIKEEETTTSVSVKPYEDGSFYKVDEDGSWKSATNGIPDSDTKVTSVTSTACTISYDPALTAAVSTAISAP